jgi:geranylgeranyl pyrophosphate synthase
MSTAPRRSKTDRIGVHSDIMTALGLEAEIGRLRRALKRWVSDSSMEMRAALEWQFSEGAKYFRPLTVFSCFRAMHREDIDDEVRVSALVIELIHNMTLVVDDILDKSEYRRKKLTLHSRFGLLPALMTSGFIVSEAYRLVRTKPREIDWICELISRLGVAECLQWRLRSQPLGVEDWWQIASEDTGSMFEICACLGSGSERLRRYGLLLGVLYHGCDDVADVKGLEALGGGGDADVRDGILTLPAAIAIRNSEVAALFRSPTEDTCHLLAAAFNAAVPEAERRLDEIAAQARREAVENADEPRDLLTLVEYTRGLSGR